MLHAIHGFTETDISWTEFFAPEGRPLTSHLLPGHGWSPCPPDTSMASAAGSIVDQLAADGSDDLLGYSMGGRVALQAAIDHPERIRRLVLVSCSPGIADSEMRTTRADRDERLAQILEEDGIGPFVSWWENQPVMRTAREVPRRAREALRSRRMNQDPEGLACALRTLGQGQMGTLWDRLSAVTAETLLIAGDADAPYIDCMTRMAEAIPSARLHAVPEAGHALHRECPEELRRIIRRFLDR